MEKGLSLVEVMIVVAIIALLGIITIPNLLKLKINRNESGAKETLRIISVACESYAKAHNDNYPDSIGNLTTVNPPYLKDSDILEARGGYNYNCVFSNGYSCVAIPEICIKTGQTTGTGTRKFTVTTGRLITESPCFK